MTGSKWNQTYFVSIPDKSESFGGQDPNYFKKILKL